VAWESGWIPSPESPLSPRRFLSLFLWCFTSLTSGLVMTVRGSTRKERKRRNIQIARKKSSTLPRSPRPKWAAGVGRGG
jgi:hypothetical protein